MNKKILILTALVLAGCGQVKSQQANSCGGAGPSLSRMDFDSNEVMAQQNQDLKILVLGHLYDFMYNPNGIALQSTLVDFINNQHADIVVFGGDSIVGPQATCGEAELDAQWKALNALKSRISARIIQVAGNHDSTSTRYPSIADSVYTKFISENKVNFTIDTTVYNRHVGLFFVYNGDGIYPAARFQPIADQFQNFDESLVFGGTLTQGSGTVINTLNSAPSHFTYFSGDNQLDNTTVYEQNFDGYNVTTYCPWITSDLDATLITVGQNGTTVSALGHCDR